MFLVLPLKISVLNVRLFPPCLHLHRVISSLQIDREREGEQIDRALLKNVLGIFVEIGMSSMDAYEHDFEVALLADTAEFYSRKASTWIVEDSCPDYMRKAEECLRKEKERVGHYLHQSSEAKLLEVNRMNKRHIFTICSFANIRSFAIRF